MGDLALDRVAGDFPDELVFMSIVGTYQVWVKSRKLLEGPWEWVVSGLDGHPVDFSSTFETRTECVADLEYFIERTHLLPQTSSTADPLRGEDLLSVTASETPESATSRPEACNSRGAVAGVFSLPEDGEVLALGLELAIVTLRKARAKIQLSTG